MNKELIEETISALQSVNGLVVKSEDINCDFDELIYKLTTELVKPTSIEDYFNEWERAITELNEKGIELINLKESFNQLEQEIVNNTDFKELYGANNQKVRDNHVRNELKDLVDKKHDLELRIEHLKRRITYIKSLMEMQGILLEAGVVE